MHPLSRQILFKAAMNEGLLLVPAGPQVVRFVPPLIVNADEVHQAVVATEKALSSLKRTVSSVEQLQAYILVWGTFRQPEG